jgi:WD40 repeat protein
MDLDLNPRLLITGSDDNTIAVWNFETGAVLRKLDG